ncbi:uncharacterized protein LOC126311214 [Schistocerca gregaria]|uniref:uncharacterized protein LOC126311214 n=1 Tax=Schistocerca gregaria TaxID=7010 RepID=UPI00211EECA6|nr:uncharacterized protein LOC126311214 [Schistocerca gregaria]
MNHFERSISQWVNELVRRNEYVDEKTVISHLKGKMESARTPEDRLVAQEYLLRYIDMVRGPPLSSRASADAARRLVLNSLSQNARADKSSVDAWRRESGERHEGRKYRKSTTRRGEDGPKRSARDSTSSSSSGNGSGKGAPPASDVEPGDAQRESCYKRAKKRRGRCDEDAGGDAGARHL